METGSVGHDSGGKITQQNEEHWDGESGIRGLTCPMRVWVHAHTSTVALIHNFRKALLMKKIVDPVLVFVT